MPKKQKRSQKVIHQYPKDIKDAKVAPEVITDQAEITQVPAWKQRQLDALKPYKFKPGQSGNPSGRAPDIVKGIAMRIAQLQVGKILDEKEIDKLKKLGLDSADMTVIENIILDWATSGNPIKQQMYIERISGRVPNVNINAEINAGLVTKFKNKFTDSELEAIAGGANAMDILFDKLPDVEEDNTIDGEFTE